MKWSGIGTTVFAVPRGFAIWPGFSCRAPDGRDWLDITPWQSTVPCPARRPQVPPVPPSDVVGLQADPKGVVHVDASLPRPVTGFDQRALRASRTTLPPGWQAVPAGLPAHGIGSPTAASEVAALEAAGFRTRVEQVSYWSGPDITTSPEIGAPARIGRLVTVYQALPPPAVARLSGRLVETGGLGASRPVHGWVHVRGGPIDDYVDTDAHGRWGIQVPGGTAYTITGAFGTNAQGAAEESCRAARRVTPRTQQFAASSGIDVVCPVT
jgi:hypothetical protein